MTTAVATKPRNGATAMIAGADDEDAAARAARPMCSEVLKCGVVLTGTLITLATLTVLLTSITGLAEAMHAPGTRVLHTSNSSARFRQVPSRRMCRA